MRQEIVSQLIDVGRELESGSDAHRPLIMRHDVMILPNECIELAATLTLGDLKRMTMAFVFLERVFENYRFGSVSPAIWFFRQYVQRVDERDSDLGGWILKYSVNPYLPWGTTRCRAQSLFDYRQWEDEQERRHKKAVTEEAARQSVAHGARLQRDRQSATANLPNAIRRKDISAVSALLRKGADPSAPNAFGKPCLQIALETGDERITELIKSATAIVK